MNIVWFNKDTVLVFHCAGNSHRWFFCLRCEQDVSIALICNRCDTWWIVMNHELRLHQPFREGKWFVDSVWVPITYKSSFISKTHRHPVTVVTHALQPQRLKTENNISGTKKEALPVSFPYSLLQHTVVTVPGNHHVHLNNPEIVAPIVSDFLRTTVLSQLAAPEGPKSKL